MSWNIKRQLDIIEQVGLLLFYIWFFRRLWPASMAEMTINVSLLLISESLVVILLLIRKPTLEISVRLEDWLVAFTCTFLPLLVRKGEDPLLMYLGLWLMIFGVITHLSAKLSLFRSFGIVPANRGVKIRGLYAIVRHPMYAGYFFTHLGFLLSSPSLWNLFIYSCTWGLMMFRVLSEEKVLESAPEYVDYARKVKYRIIPGVF